LPSKPPSLAIYAVSASPERSRSHLKRADQPAHELAKALAHSANGNLAKNRFYVGVLICWQLRKSKDQAALGAVARQSNLQGTMASAKNLKNRRVILIDDIVTTGSTLRET
jgi:predicted amidophosphoribosyltransferase